MELGTPQRGEASHSPQPTAPFLSHRGSILHSESFVKMLEDSLVPTSNLHTHTHIHTLQIAGNIELHTLRESGENGFGEEGCADPGRVPWTQVPGTPTVL